MGTDISLKELDRYGRITIYAAQEERRELLRKLLAYTKAKSLSEAVFIALAEFVKTQEEQGGAELPEESRGAWADDPLVEKALEELEEGWKRWSES